MSRRTLWLAITILVAGLLAFPLLAQGPQSHAGRGPNGIMLHAGGGPGQGTGPSHLDLSGKVALEGLVEDVSMGPGRGTPNFTMTADGKKVTIVTSPYRLVMNANFRISLGDRINVLAYPFVGQQDTFAAAELKNLTTGAVLTLRDESGFPMMNHGNCGNCPLNHTTQP